jgi:nuclear transport factor 2 (NTF2) superfamily protein
VFTTAPFSKLYREARRGSEKDVRLLNELGAFYTSRALVPYNRDRKKDEGNFTYPGEKREV